MLGIVLSFVGFAFGVFSPIVELVLLTSDAEIDEFEDVESCEDVASPMTFVTSFLSVVTSVVELAAGLTMKSA